MIRIDLGRGERKSKSGTNIADLLAKAKERLPKSFQAKMGKAKKHDWKEMAGFAIAAAVGLLPYLFVAQYKSYVKSQHELQMQKYVEREGQLKAEIDRYRSYQRELESYEKQKRLIKERIQVVRQLLEARNTPVNAFDAIGQSLPDKAWLSNVELKVNPTPSISISGSAYSNEEISDYVDKLAESIQLKDVSLESVTSTRSEKDLEVKQFVVSALPSGQLAITPEPVRQTATQNANPNPNPNIQKPGSKGAQDLEP